MLQTLFVCWTIVTIGVGAHAYLRQMLKRRTLADSTPGEAAFLAMLVSAGVGLASATWVAIYFGLATLEGKW